MANQSLGDAFAAFSKFGNTKSDGSQLSLSQIDKWLKQAGIFNKNLTTTDTAIAFNKFKSKTIDLSNFQKFLEMLCNEKKLKYDDIAAKLSGMLPGTTKATRPSQSGVVDRLTDTAKYTGSHKERFDQSGKGRGIEGRQDVKEDAGYVSGYKNKDTYDEK